MQILAKAVFSSLRSDPYKFESEISLTEGRRGRKLLRKNEIKGTPVRTSRPTGVKIGASPLGPRDDGEPTLAKRDDPQFYRPWTSFCTENEALVSSVYNASKTLVIDENFGARYKQSLIWFCQRLGTSSEESDQVHPSSSNPITEYTQTSSRTVFFTKKCYLAQFPITSLQNSPGSCNVLLGRNTFLNLNVKASSSVDRSTVQQLTNLMPPPKEPITQSRNNHQLGKRPMLDNIAQNTSLSQFVHGNLLGKMPMLENSIARNTTNFNIFGSSSRESRATPMWLHNHLSSTKYPSHTKPCPSKRTTNSKW